MSGFRSGDSGFKFRVLIFGRGGLDPCDGAILGHVVGRDRQAEIDPSGLLNFTPETPPENDATLVRHHFGVGGAAYGRGDGREAPNLFAYRFPSLVRKHYKRKPTQVPLGP